MQLRYIFADGMHNFLLFTGSTKLGTQAGVWCGYKPPMESEPGVIEMLYATRESRALMCPVLGIAGWHSLETYGELPVGSHNLSCHSFPIQQRLAFILGQIPAEATENFENWIRSIEILADWAKRFESASGKVIPLAELEKGRDFTLQILSSEAAQTPVPAWAIEKDRGYAMQRRANGLVLNKLERDANI